jgi:mercuric ion transport protein
VNTTVAPSPAHVRRSFWLEYLALFSSFGTLLCCALPSLLVLFGLGATVASVLAAAPWLVSLSRHKVWVFAIAGGLIAANVAYVYVVAPGISRANQACAPDDPTCGSATRFSRVVLWLSAAIYVIGALTAFALGPLLLWWDARH